MQRSLSAPKLNRLPRLWQTARPEDYGMWTLSLCLPLTHTLALFRSHIEAACKQFLKLKQRFRHFPLPAVSKQQHLCGCCTNRLTVKCPFQAFPQNFVAFRLVVSRLDSTRLDSTLLQCFPYPFFFFWLWQNTPLAISAWLSALSAGLLLHYFECIHTLGVCVCASHWLNLSMSSLSGSRSVCAWQPHGFGCARPKACQRHVHANTNPNANADANADAQTPSRLP